MRSSRANDILKVEFGAHVSNELALGTVEELHQYIDSVYG